MKISAKYLKNVVDVNHFDYSNQWSYAEGSAHDLYLQLTDADQDGLRYISQAVVQSLSATFLSIDDSTEITIAGTQPFASDKSIWKFSLTAAQIPNAGAVKFTLIEDAVTKIFKMNQAITVDLLADGGC